MKGHISHHMAALAGRTIQVAHVDTPEVVVGEEPTQVGDVEHRLQAGGQSGVSPMVAGAWLALFCTDHKAGPALRGNHRNGSRS
jgi:hypothetical protein